jgi:hypothetical protein
MSINNCGCEDPCSTPACPEPLTTNDIQYVGADDTCIGIVRPSTLTDVLDQLRAFLVNRLFGVVSSSLVVTYPAYTCNRVAQVELVPSTDEGNILVLGTDGHPYVPETVVEDGGGAITIADTATINLSGDGDATPISGVVILDPSNTNITTATSGILTEESQVSDIRGNLIQDITFEIPPIPQLTYTDGAGSHSALVLGLAGGASYATNFTANNPDVKVFWDDTAIYEKSFDNEAGAGHSLTHTYPAIFSNYKHVNIRGYNTSYITDFSTPGYNILPSGFSAKKGASLITDLVFSGAVFGTTGEFDFKGMYNLDTFRYGSTYNGVYPLSTGIIRSFKNMNDLHSLLSFDYTGVGVEKNTNLIFNNTNLSRIQIISAGVFDEIRAVDKLSIGTLTFFVTSANYLNFTNSRFVDLTIYNCGYLFGGFVNKLSLPLNVAHNTTGSGMFEFTGTRGINIYNINGTETTDGNTANVIPTKIMMPVAGTSLKLFTNVDQDWIKDELVISLDQNTLTQGSLFLRSTNATKSIGLNFNAAYYNPTWAPLNGESTVLQSTIVAGVVTSITTPPGEGGTLYTTVPTIVDSGAGSGLVASAVMSPYYGLTNPITSAGTGYTVNQIVTLTGAGSIVSPTIQVTSIDGFGGVTDFFYVNSGEFTSLPATLTHAGGLVISTTARWTFKRALITSGGTGYDATTVFTLTLASGNGSGTGTASSAAKAAIESLRTKGWKLRW